LRNLAYYRDRGDGDLVDTNDVRVGRCYPFPAAFLTCGLTFDRLEVCCDHTDYM